MFSTLSEFVLMDGYALYVWPAYGLVLGLLAVQLFRPWKRWRNLIKQTTPSNANE